MSQSVGPRHHRARSWGRLQMIGIRTTTNVNDIDRRRGSPSTGGDQLQKPSLQEVQHQSTLRARPRRSFSGKTPLPNHQPLPNTNLPTSNNNLQESDSDTTFKADYPSNITTTVSQGRQQSDSISDHVSQSDGLRQHRPRSRQSQLELTLAFFFKNK